MRAVALICARGGSKGLPGKNIKPLAGRPLIAWAIAHAKAVTRIERVIVSTDSAAIASVARDHGADVPFMRPPELARDDSPEWLAWRHALEYMKATDGAYPDALVSVPATAPLRSPSDIERCLDRFAEGDADIVITVTDAHRNPYFNMVTVAPGGGVTLVIQPAGTLSRRQDAPPIFDMTTVAFVARPDFVMAKSGVFEGRVRHVHVPLERAIDIDTALDFSVAESLLTARSAAQGA